MQNWCRDVDEIEQGIDGTELKAGIIAEIGSSEGKITPLEEKVFIAAALVHNQTDVRSPRIPLLARWGWNNCATASPRS
ncbi:phosphotriesterase-like protein [Escherichia coli]|uniref:Phosphotriesterase-like protein n=1 Tax=Escherichia coli TaxID=562 RepID=A0A377DC38_ECOLX|nr:phosphotriesterase-like protein [Escherichia coli]